MRIGIDCRLWNQTGVGRYIRNLIINLQKIDKKNNYILFVRSIDKKNVKLRISNSKFKILNCNIPWHSFEEQLKFSKILNKENLDLVHFPYISIPISINIPFVVTIHDLIPYRFPTGKASTLPLYFYKFKFLAYKFIVSQAAKKAKRIITPSKATKKDIVEYLKVPTSKIEVIYEGVDHNLKNHESLKKENIALYVGNAYPHKNLETVLFAIKNLNNVKLILVGKEDYFYKRLKRKVKEAGLDGQVLFYGFTDEKELLVLYKKAKTLILPSFAEGFGLPVLEAMANGCLVLASDIPVLHEVGGEAAVYFDPRNSESLRNLLEKVYSNTLVYKSKIELGFKRSKQFSWQKTVKETLKIYESSVSLRQS